MWPSPSTSVSVMVMLPLGAPSPAWKVRSVNTPWPSLMNNATPPPSVLTRRSRSPSPSTSANTASGAAEPGLEGALVEHAVAVVDEQRHAPAERADQEVQVAAAVDVGEHGAGGGRARPGRCAR